MSSQKFQVVVGPNGRFKQQLRYAIDVCVCGHTWAEHYQPRPGGKAACYGKTPSGFIDECHNFQLATDQ